MNRKEREREFKQKEILLAARQVFALRGFENATLDEIAEQAEYGKGTIYNYFESKDQIFDSVIADGFNEFISIANETCGNADLSLEDSFHRFAENLLEHLFNNMGLHSLIMRELHKLERNTRLANMFPELLCILEQPLKRAIEKREIPKASSSSLAFLYLSMVFTIFRSAILSRCTFPCSDDWYELSFSPEEINAEIEKGKTLLKMTYFNGLLTANA